MIILITSSVIYRHAWKEKQCIFLQIIPVFCPLTWNKNVIVFKQKIYEMWKKSNLYVLCICSLRSWWSTRSVILIDVLDWIWFLIAENIANVDSEYHFKLPIILVVYYNQWCCPWATIFGLFFKESFMKKRLKTFCF